MKSTIQVKTTVEAAEAAIRHMELNGYQAVECRVSDNWTDVHFKINGQTSADYNVTIFRDPDDDKESYGFVGFRPQ